MPNSKYGTFRNRTEVNTNVTIRQASDFIEKSASSVDAFRESTETDIKAVIISEQKEGGNETILFTYAVDNVVVGEFITYRNKTYMVYGQYEIIFSNEFKKHKMIECNVTLKNASVTQRAYYISSLRKYVSLANDTDSYIPYEFSTQRPVIVTKANTNIKPGERFLVNGEPFIVNDIDKLSNDGVFYMSVEKSTIIPGVDNTTTKVAQPVPAPVLDNLEGDIVAGENITILTNGGYAVFSSDVDIVSKNATTIIFEAPIGVKHLTVKTKNSSGNIVTTNYRVVI
jgi:hypothetical protein